MKMIKKMLLTIKTLEIKNIPKSFIFSDSKTQGFLGRFDQGRVANFLKIGIFIIIPLVILTPEIRVTSPAIRLDEVLLIVLALAYLIFKLKRLSIRISIIDYIFAALFVSVVASLTISVIRENAFYFNDLFEFIKLIKYYLIYRIIFSLDWRKRDFDIVVRIIVLSFVVSVIFSIAQYFNFLAVNNRIMPLFTKSNHIRAILNAGRVVGTFKNANMWALSLGVPLFYIFAMLFKKMGQKSVRYVISYIIFLFLAITSIMMTMSRTSVVANFVALLVITATLLWPPLHNISQGEAAKKIFKIFVIFSVVSLLSFAFITNIPNKKGYLNIAERFEIGLNDVGLTETDVDGESMSWSSRKGKWIDVIGKSVESPIFGFGPSKSVTAKANLSYAVDNEYLLYLYRYGLVGLSLYISLFFSFLFYAFINIRNTVKNNDSSFLLNVLALGVSVSYPLYNILAGSFYNFQLFPLLLILATLNINMWARDVE